jgi:hypothetical protein
MRSEPGQSRATARARWAQLTSLVFGIALLVWGLAPTVVSRLVTGEAPTLANFGLGALVMLLGVCFLGLSVLIARGVGWALWTALWLAMVLAAGNLALTYLAGRTPSVFPLLLAGATAGTCWWALDGRRGGPASTPPTAEATK